MSWTPVHLDEHGQPCARHGTATLDALLTLAFIGTRANGFNHDLATKLQNLELALDDLGHLAAKLGDGELRRVAAEVGTAREELSKLLTANRALTRSGQRARSRLRDLARIASERSSVVFLTEPPDVEVVVTASRVSHALTIVLDVAKGHPNKSGQLAAIWRCLDAHVELELATVGSPPPLAAEYLVLAAEVLRRDGGDLRCGEDRFVIRLPLRGA